MIKNAFCKACYYRRRDVNEKWCTSPKIPCKLDKMIKGTTVFGWRKINLHTTQHKPTHTCSYPLFPLLLTVLSKTKDPNGSLHDTDCKSVMSKKKNTAKIRHHMWNVSEMYLHSKKWHCKENSKLSSYIYTWCTFIFFSFIYFNHFIRNKCPNSSRAQ